MAVIWTTTPDNGGKPLFHRQMRLVGILPLTSTLAAYNYSNESADSVAVNFARMDTMSMIGKTLAHYEITSQLGRGGMREVFRAKDQKLGREVAIKVLVNWFEELKQRVPKK
jgi:serine/threonine protein kinase